MKRPTLKEIADHMNDQQEAILFYNYYESVGWKVGKNKMQRWKSAASGWITRNKKRETQSISKVDKALSNTSTDMINLLWKRMTEIYGHKWVSSYGTEPTRPWIELISSMSKEKIKHGLNTLIREGEDWPCSLIKFNQMCQSGAKPLCKPKDMLMIGSDLKLLRKRTVNARAKFMEQAKLIL